MNFNYFKNIDIDFITSTFTQGDSVLPIGSIPLDSQMSLASVYYDAAQALLESSLNEYSYYDIKGTIHPILYLYRHSIELCIKGIIPSARGHNLTDLFNKLREFLKTSYDLNLSENVESLIKFINSIDDKSTLFRYADEIKKKIPEMYIDVKKLKQTMTELNSYFVLLKAHIETGICQNRNNTK
ncbi:hypothetical protein B1207_07645 [Legionella quinlivanii]|uniref:HEPN domain-containing protein n=1 Tax=Legionella quinlivanii TaxID=45073 RepID=A0A364LJF4_9GAMM|nr:hypothetical protein [Legionella quinlivanii]RAP36667.1 hypothetical protein B1207_07645 [Legionella quinlivanii]